MPQICLYFQLHQPYRLGDFSVFDLGRDQSYFTDKKTNQNQAIFQKVSLKSYRPMLTLLAKLVADHSQFKVSLSCSGVFLEQAEQYDPVVVGLLEQLAASSQVEFLAETYYHSLASLYSPAEFKAQVDFHTQKLQELFDHTPTTFRNTELIYVNAIAEEVIKMGFKGMLTEAVPRYLHGRTLTQPFRSLAVPHLPLLLKHAQLSDDIAFRFSNPGWQWFPLGVDRYLDWVEVYGESELINLFMDFETFGEHQWAETGIFTFFQEFVERFLAHDWNNFILPSEAIAQAELQTELPIYDVPKPISWADVDRDLTAWIENPLQQDSLKKIYELQDAVLESENQALITDWRKLQTSDHFYYMCTKWAADGDVHAYFSPYDSPYEAYRRYSVVLADMVERVW